MKRRAELSVAMNPGCSSRYKARAAIDRVFDRCFADTAPFDRCPHSPPVLSTCPIRPCFPSCSLADARKLAGPGREPPSQLARFRP